MESEKRRLITHLTHQIDSLSRAVKDVENYKTEMGEILTPKDFNDWHALMVEKGIFKRMTRQLKAYYYNEGLGRPYELEKVNS